MYAEMQMLTPLVPTREAFFLRYCKRLSATCWALVDVSVDGLRSDPPPVMLKCRRRPSGCLIQVIPRPCTLHAKPYTLSPTRKTSNPTP